MWYPWKESRPQIQVARALSGSSLQADSSAVSREQPEQTIRLVPGPADSCPRNAAAVLARDSSGRWPGRSQHQLRAHVSFSSGIPWGKKDKILFISVCCLQKHRDLLGSTTHGTVAISGLNKSCCSLERQLYKIFNQRRLVNYGLLISASVIFPKPYNILITSDNSQPHAWVPLWKSDTKLERFD